MEENAEIVSLLIEKLRLIDNLGGLSVLLKINDYLQGWIDGLV